MIGATLSSSQIFAGCVEITFVAQEESIQLGIVEISLPTVSDSQCSIFMDLTEALGVEFNSEAESTLRSAWKERGYKGKLDWDSEADFVGVSGGRQAIVDVSILINELTKSPTIEPERIEEVRRRLRAFRRPKAKAWRVGDVFAVPLADGSFGYGQVLWRGNSESYFPGPTLLLFDCWSTGSHPTLDEILTSPSISITHEDGEELDKGEWLIMGNHEPVDDPCRGRGGAPGRSSGNGVTLIANAWRGFPFWNNFGRDDYLDALLLPGVQRPAGVQLLPLDLCATCHQKRPIVQCDDPGGPICVACESIRRRG